MKYKSLLVYVFVFSLVACKQPIDEEETYYLGLFLINSSSETITFKVKTGIFENIKQEDVAPNKEWHMQSIYYGMFLVGVFDAQPQLIAEKSVYVPHSSQKKAATIEWTGENFIIGER